MLLVKTKPFPSFLLSKIETEASVTGIPASFATAPFNLHSCANEIRAAEVNKIR